MQPSRMSFALACVSCLFMVNATRAISSEPGLVKDGLVRERPADGQFVETNRSYMVPYEVVVPGTEVKFIMTPIPGGTFTLGSPETEVGRKQDEGPQTKIRVEPFWMGRYEVTWGDYKPFMEKYLEFKELQSLTWRLAKPKPQDFDGKTPEQIAAIKARRAKAAAARLALSQQLEDDRFAELRTILNEEPKLVDGVTIPTPLVEPEHTFEYGEDPRLPAVTMTPYAARQYTKWISGLTGQFFRLPAEAEWEYACRAGSKTAYHFGDDRSKLVDYAWYAKNSDETPHFVGLKKPNAWGLFDMHGNVAEWVIDEYKPVAYKRLAGKEHSAADSIVWPTTAYPRVVRGGSWDDSAKACRSAARFGEQDDTDEVDKGWKEQDPNGPLSPWWFTEDPTRGIGFRVVRPLAAPKNADRSRYWKIYDELVLEDVQNRLYIDGRGIVGPSGPTVPKALEQLQELKKLQKGS